jgi:hypothetical protein
MRSIDPPAVRVRTQEGPKNKIRRAGGAHKAPKSPNRASPSRAATASDWRSGRRCADANVDEAFDADEDADDDDADNDDADVDWGLDFYDDDAGNAADADGGFALPVPAVLFECGQHAQAETGWGGMTPSPPHRGWSPGTPPLSPTVEAFG